MIIRGMKEGPAAVNGAVAAEKEEAAPVVAEETEGDNFQIEIRCYNRKEQNTGKRKKAASAK
jgi:hypothetical protein